MRRRFERRHYRALALAIRTATNVNEAERARLGGIIADVLEADDKAGAIGNNRPFHRHRFLMVCRGHRSDY